MISTVDTTLSVINGYACIVPVQYPNWYDIPGIGFIFLTVGLIHTLNIKVNRLIRIL